MQNWKNEEAIDWLLEDGNPSVKYFTLVDLLEKSKDDSEVLDAKEQIMKSEVIQKILLKQNPGGYWFEP